MTHHTYFAIFSTLLITTSALAQGTASSPSTFHIAEPTGVAYAGGTADGVNGPAPYPIDLDPTGGPWRKSITTDPTGSFVGFSGFTLIETVQNVGTEPWFDWHEDLFPGAIGAAWLGVTSLTVNGNPITFNQNIIANSLWVDSFSQPVLPGDIMVIEKDLVTTANVVGPGVTLFEVLEYPTPEPTSAAMMGGAMALLLRRRLARRVPVDSLACPAK